MTEFIKRHFKKIALDEIKEADRIIYQLDILFNSFENDEKPKLPIKIDENRLNRKIMKNYKKFFIYTHNFDVDKMEEIHKIIVDLSSEYLLKLEEIQNSENIVAHREEEENGEIKMFRNENAYIVQAKSLQEAYENRMLLLEIANA